GYRPGIEMVTANHDRRPYLAAGDPFVEPQPCPVPFPLAEPADARRQAPKLHVASRGTEPEGEVLVFREGLDQGAVGHGDVFRIAGERDPAKRSLTFAEEWPHVSGDEAGEGEGILQAAELGLAAQVVAVVEDD